MLDQESRIAALRRIEKLGIDFVRTKNQAVLCMCISNIYEYLKQCVFDEGDFTLHDTSIDADIAKAFEIKFSTVYTIRTLRNRIVHGVTLNENDLEVIIRNAVATIGWVDWQVLLASMYMYAGLKKIDEVIAGLYKKITFPNKVESRCRLLLSNLPPATLNQLSGKTNYQKLQAYLKM